MGLDADILMDKIPQTSTVLRDISVDSAMYRLLRLAFEESSDKKLLKLLANSAVHILTERGESILPAAASKGCDFALNAARLINENFTEDITLVSVAKELAVSPQYLSSVFKLNIGMNFSEYLRNLRLDYACRLLENSESSVTEICFKVGWGNYSHFSRIFKLIYGMSPKKYRKKHMSN